MRRFVAGLSVLVFIVAACGGAGATPTPAPAAVKLASSALGQIVVDAQGNTLYGFTPDEAGGQATCVGQCAGNWPALIVSGSFSVGTGLSQADFNTVTRSDGGGTQLKFKQHPLYHYSGDSAAGQTNGQGVGSKWYVVGADGALIGQ